jgi:hypothetical protein
MPWAQYLLITAIFVATAAVIEELFLDRQLKRHKYMPHQ